MPNKTEKTYHRFLEALKIPAPDSRPEKFLLVFEQAAIQAFQKSFTETKLSGCFFHLSQSFMRKIAVLGLKKDYETNHEFVLALKILPALAFEKEEEMGKSYDKIVEEIQIVCDCTIKYSEKIAKVDEFCFYFGSNYIKSLVPNREALFPPSLWNQRDAASSGLARTTNAVEGWQCGIQSYFSGLNPSIWKVIANLQKDASVLKLNFFNASSGHQFTKKKKYRLLNEKVQNFMHVYEEKTDLPFFCAMANLS